MGQIVNPWEDGHRGEHLNYCLHIDHGRVLGALKPGVRLLVVLGSGLQRNKTKPYVVIGKISKNKKPHILLEKN